MRSWFSLGATLALVGFGCGGEDFSAPVEAGAALPTVELRQETAALEVGDTELSLPEGRLSTRAPEREWLFDDVAHYSYRVQVGPGTYDAITVHRVVREQAPWRPARAAKAVFMVHGDSWGFTSAFLSSTRSSQVAVDRSIAAYLAEQGVDVWGIDLRWVGVPLGVKDFSFMSGWTLGTHVKDVGTGLALADTVRQLSGGNKGSMFLLGWSRGATVGYAYLDAESQRPRGLRRVDGFIPVDMPLRFAPQDDEQRQWACERYTVLKQARDSGRTEGGLLGTAPGTTVQLIGQLAVMAPDAPSPLLPEGALGPSLPQPTNRQFAVIAAGATSALFAPLKPIAPAYHMTAAVPDPVTGLPGRLAFTSEPYVFDYLRLSAPYQSINEVVETEAQLCGLDVPYDDHLDDVKVPVLYVGAGGGVGRYGVHTLGLLGSRDVTVHIARTLPESSRAIDFGHMDLFLASDARERVWKPIHQWMRAH